MKENSVAFERISFWENIHNQCIGPCTFENVLCNKQTTELSSR